MAKDVAKIAEELAAAEEQPSVEYGVEGRLDNLYMNLTDAALEGTMKAYREAVRDTARELADIIQNLQQGTLKLEGGK